MNIITYILTLIASFSGIIAGIIISHIAMEEIPAASRYLKYLNVILSATIAFIATHRIDIVYASILAVVMVTAYILTFNRNNSVWIYSSMGALIYLSAVSDELLNVAILIFLYGMSIATIHVNDRYQINNGKRTDATTSKENIRLTKEILLKHSTFLIVGILSYILSHLIRNI